MIAQYDIASVYTDAWRKVAMGIAGLIVVSEIIRHGDTFAPVVSTLVAEYERRVRQEWLTRLDYAFKQRLVVVQRVESWHWESRA